MQVPGAHLTNGRRPLRARRSIGQTLRQSLQRQQQRRRRLPAEKGRPEQGLLETTAGRLSESIKPAFGRFRPKRPTPPHRSPAFSPPNSDDLHPGDADLPVQLPGHVERPPAVAVDAHVLQWSQLREASQFRGAIVPHPSGLHPAALCPRALLPRAALSTCHTWGVARVHPRASHKGQSTNPRARAVSRSTAEGSSSAPPHEDSEECAGARFARSLRPISGKQVQLQRLREQEHFVPTEPKLSEREHVHRMEVTPVQTTTTTPFCSSAATTADWSLVGVALCISICFGTTAEGRGRGKRRRSLRVRSLYTYTDSFHSHRSKRWWRDAHAKGIQHAEEYSIRQHRREGASDEGRVQRVPQETGQEEEESRTGKCLLTMVTFVMNPVCAAANDSFQCDIVIIVERYEVNMF